jgi:N-acetylglutamate synthase-like GNAT family acetyltransferase
MTSRILPPSEWPKLDEAGAETVWPMLDPDRAQILVIEDQGQIVGTLTLMSVLHAECLWIKPSHRGQYGVGKRLLDAMWTAARGQGVKALWSGSISDTMTNILHRIGASEVPGRSFVFPVREGESCRQL